MNSQNIEIFSIANKGKGIVASRNFSKDEVVFTVCGPITTTPSTITVPIDYDLYIDPLPPGCYLNHSCDPSCGIKNRNQVVAMREIKKGEEINIDYAMIVPEYSSEMTQENRICRCGAKSCRGKLGAYKELSKQVKKKYSGYISDYLES